MIRILVNGANGRMGRLACSAIESASDLTLVDRCGRGDDLAARIVASQAEVVVDFTTPEAVDRTAAAIVAAGARPVIGTTGMTAATRETLVAACAARRLGGVLAPNFAIGALLMLRFAEEAARWMPAAEIVEAHHQGKKDAPSGTAIATAERIARARREAGAWSAAGPARGESRSGIPVHSIRLPGVVAEQSVIFGELGQKLVLEHVAYGREAYMPGVLLACRQVVTLERLVQGLDTLLFGAPGTPDAPRDGTS